MTGTLHIDAPQFVARFLYARLCGTVDDVGHIVRNVGQRLGDVAHHGHYPMANGSSQRLTIPPEGSQSVGSLSVTAGTHQHVNPTVGGLQQLGYDLRAQQSCGARYENCSFSHVSKYWLIAVVLSL